MARLFDATNTEALRLNATPPVTANDFAASIWVRPASTSVPAVWMSMGDKDVGNFFWHLQNSGVGSARSYIHEHAIGDISAVLSSNTYTANTWHHFACAVMQGHHYVYLDGDVGNKGSDTTTIPYIANWDSVAIGEQVDDTPSAWADGQAAWGAVWDLTDWGGTPSARYQAFEKQLPAMAAGYSPLFWPTGLRAFWPLGGFETEEVDVGGAQDIVGGFDLTATTGTGPDIADHFGGLIYPTTGLSFPPEAQSNALEAAVSASGDVNASLSQTKYFTAAISSIGTLGAELTRIGSGDKPLVTAVSTAGSLTASLDVAERFTASISASATVSASFGETTSLSASITATGNVVARLIIFEDLTSTLNFNQHAFAVVLAEKTYVLLQAPFDAPQISIALPNPLLDDSENLVSDLIVHHSMSGVRRTCIKTSDSRRLNYTFVMDRLKGLELEGFINAYNGAKIRMLNWKGEIWKINLITNPVDFVQARRGDPCGNSVDVNLEFEGVKLYG